MKDGAHPINVLLVEDDEDDFLLTRDLLSEIRPGEYELEWIRSFEDAVALDNGDCYDVCLLDYRLGSGNGLDLMRELQSRGYKCPMILLTGQGDSEIDHQAMQGGAADYLIKGQINAANLERSIRYSIQQRKTEAERLALLREQAARERAEEANKAKDDFLAILSHELRSPLNVILGWSRLLRSNQHNDEMFNKAVDTIERSALMQAKFVEDLLDVNRIVSGTIRVTMRPLDLNAIVASAIDGMRPVADAKSVSIGSQTAAEILTINGDSERLLQIVNNILNNAVKFTPDGGRIFVDLKKAGSHARITVSDTGQGIHKDFLPLVFERYRQGSDTMTSRKSGLGLGLAIVRHLTEMHGGTVSAESDGEGRGSTFTILLPLENVETD